MDGIKEDVEAQVWCKASGGDDVIINSDRDISQLYSSDFEGMEL
jgi:hypothetical protein